VGYEQELPRWKETSTGSSVLTSKNYAQTDTRQFPDARDRVEDLCFPPPWSEVRILVELLDQEKQNAEYSSIITTLEEMLNLIPRRRSLGL